MPSKQFMKVRVGALLALEGFGTDAIEFGAKQNRKAIEALEALGYQNIEVGIHVMNKRRFDEPEKAKMMRGGKTPAAGLVDKIGDAVQQAAQPNMSDAPPVRERNPAPNDDPEIPESLRQRR